MRGRRSRIKVLIASSYPAHAPCSWQHSSLNRGPSFFIQTCPPPRRGCASSRRILLGWTLLGWTLLGGTLLCWTLLGWTLLCWTLLGGTRLLSRRVRASI